MLRALVLAGALVAGGAALAQAGEEAKRAAVEAIVRGFTQTDLSSADPLASPFIEVNLRREHFSLLRETASVERRKAWLATYPEFRLEMAQALGPMVQRARSVAGERLGARIRASFTEDEIARLAAFAVDPRMRAMQRMSAGVAGLLAETVFAERAFPAVGPDRTDLEVRTRRAVEEVRAFQAANVTFLESAAQDPAVKRLDAAVVDANRALGESLVREVFGAPTVGGVLDRWRARAESGNW